MKTILLTALLSFFSVLAFAQGVAISTDNSTADPSAMLDVKSSSAGVLVPRMSTTDRTNIASPATGLLVYDSDLNAFYYYNGTAWTAINSGGEAVNYVGTSYLGKTSGLGATGTSEGTSSNLYNIAIGDNALSANTTSSSNVALGKNALQSLVAPNYYGQVPSIAIGENALKSATYPLGNIAIGYQSQQNIAQAGNTDTDGITNISIGNGTLKNTTTGQSNTVIGYTGLENNISGSLNTAIGSGVLLNNTTGSQLTAIGYFSGTNYGNLNGINTTVHNTTGYNNTFIGAYSGVGSSGLTNATAIGFAAQVDASNSLVLGGTGTYAVNVGIGNTSPQDKLHLVGNLRVDAGRIDFRNTGQSVFIGENAGIADDFTSNINVGIGYNSLQSNNTGEQNVAVGYKSLEANTSGYNNTAVGAFAVDENTTGAYNTGLGRSAMSKLQTGNENTAVGFRTLYSNVSGETNTALGVRAGYSATGSGNIFLGYEAGYSETGSNKLYIDNGNTSSPLIWGDFSNNYLNFNANVGIGTNTPGYQLDIQSASAAVANTQSSGSSAYFQAVAPSTQEAALTLHTYSSGSALERWTLGKSTASESGSNAGSNFFINRYDDAGTYLGQPFAITRSTGQVVVGQSSPDATASTLKVNGSVAMAVSTKSASYTLTGTDYCVIFTGGSGATFTLPTASSATGRVYLIVNQGTALLTTSAYTTASGTTSTSIPTATGIQLISDGTDWRKIN